MACNRSDRAYYSFIWSQAVEMYWIIIPCWKTGELHMKLVGGSFKAKRRRCFFIQHVWVQWLKFSLEIIEDAIRQIDKTTNDLQATSYSGKVSISWAFATDRHFFCFFVVWRNRILFRQVSVQLRISVKHPRPYTQQQHPLFSHAVWSRPHPDNYLSLEHGKHSDCCGCPHVKF